MTIDNSAVCIVCNTEYWYQHDLRRDEVSVISQCKCAKDADRYEKAYHILMKHFESISDEEKPKVHKQLEELGL